MKLTPGKKHRLRLINTSSENHFTLSLAGHDFTVIQTDFVPVQPIVKKEIFLALGQRYDIIIDAKQPVDNYWFNATLTKSGLCGLSKNPFPAAIFSYQGANETLPTNPGLPVDATCKDSTGFVPIVERFAEKADFVAHQQELAVNLTTTLSSRGKLFRWTVNGSTSDVQWEKPTLQYVQEGNTSYPAGANVISLDQAGVWAFWIIDNLPGALVSAPLFNLLHPPPPDELTTAAAAPHPPARPRLPGAGHGRHGQVQRGDGHGVAQLRQPDEARRGHAAGRLARHRLPDGQPGRLAAALPHRLARQPGPERHLPRAGQPDPQGPRPRGHPAQLRRLAPLPAHHALRQDRLGPLSGGPVTRPSDPEAVSVSILSLFFGALHTVRHGAGVASCGLALL